MNDRKKSISKLIPIKSLVHAHCLPLLIPYMKPFFKAVSNKTENQSREVWLAISHGLELEIPCGSTKVIIV